MYNPYTGRHSTGSRFCFHISSIAHRPLFLPIEMKVLPEIQRLIKGESPLSVFNCNSIKEARQAFCKFRYNYDFAYWAAREYYIRDNQNTSKIIPLNLNEFQFHIIDIFQKRYHNRECGRYIITKSFGKVGVTTCVQAYILWLQIYKSNNNSCLCSYLDGDMYPFQMDLCRFLKRKPVCSERDIYIPTADRHAFFHACSYPNKFSGTDLGYVHFADMSKWNDRNDEVTYSTVTEISSSISMSFDNLLIQEGNIPSEDKLPMEKCQNPYLDRDYRLFYISNLTNNPPFLDTVIMNQASGSISTYHHINLDHLLCR